MKRRQRRSNAEINVIHREYLALLGSDLSQAEMSKKLDISTTVIRKWMDGAVPLPDADPKSKDFYNERTRNGYTSDELTLQEQILQEDTFDAQELNMTLEEYRANYASAMQKIHFMIKNDSTLGLTLRDWLDHPERVVIDGQF